MQEDDHDLVRFVSLFAGVGGFDLGLELSGHECIAQVEIDKHCRSVLEKHWPDVPKHDDVRTACEFADTIGLVGRTDLVCGGFPCQDVSVAGKRAGLAGERTGLFWDALAFSTHVQARWIVLENVPGLLTSNQGRDFGTVALALADAGYVHLEWRVLDSQFFGVPQRRRRVFIVASTSIPDRRPVLVEREGSEWNPASFRAEGPDLAADPEGSIAFSHTQGLDAQPSGSAWPTLRSGGGGHGVAVSYGFNPTGGTRDIGFAEEQAPTVRVGSGVGIPSPPGVVNALTASGLRGGWTGRQHGTSGTPGSATAVDFRHGTISDEVTATLQAKNTGGYSLNYTPGVIVDDPVHEG